MNEGSKNARQTLLYDEQKLELGAATFLGAFNYWEETSSLTFEKKLQRLQDLIDRNQRAKEKTLHTSLNFHPDDKITDKMMVQIAKEYMKEIGFAEQPWLAYRHLDAGHPHLHIVTTNIRPDGSRIDNDARHPNKLRKLYRKIENKYDLTHFIEIIPKPKELRQTTISPSPLKYGQTATKTGIANVLNYVLDNFKYTTLDQFNALLYLYRVRADRGSEQGIMYHNKGLYYRMIDGTGKKIGAPIKASAFEQKPTLKYLEQKMEENRLDLAQRMVRIRYDLNDLLFRGRSSSLEKFREDLRWRSIGLIIPPAPRVKKTRAQTHRSEQTRPASQTSQSQQTPPAPQTSQHFFYLDFKSKTIYRDTDLGQNCTAPMVLKHIQQQHEREESLSQRREHRLSHGHGLSL